jgi:hypothetical protein
MSVEAAVSLMITQWCHVYRESGDERGEGLAVSGLGEVHFTMGQYTTALSFHQAASSHVYTVYST